MKCYSKIFEPKDYYESYEWISCIKEQGEEEVLNEVFSYIGNEWNDENILYEEPYSEDDFVVENDGFVMVYNDEETKFEVYKDWNVLSEQDMEEEVGKIVRQVLYNELSDDNS